MLRPTHPYVWQRTEADADCAAYERSDTRTQFKIPKPGVDPLPGPELRRGPVARRTHFGRGLAPSLLAALARRAGRLLQTAHLGRLVVHLQEERLQRAAASAALRSGNQPPARCQHRGLDHRTSHAKPSRAAESSLCSLEEPGSPVALPQCSLPALAPAGIGSQKSARRSAGKRSHQSLRGPGRQRAVDGRLLTGTELVLRGQGPGDAPLLAGR